MARSLAEQAGLYQGALSAVADWIGSALNLPADAQARELAEIRKYVTGALDRGSALSNGPRSRPEGIAS